MNVKRVLPQYYYKVNTMIPRKGEPRSPQNLFVLDAPDREPVALPYNGGSVLLTNRIDIPGKGLAGSIDGGGPNICRLTKA